VTNLKGAISPLPKSKAKLNPGYKLGFQLLEKSLMFPGM
jgi:hypothetical protein